MVWNNRQDLNAGKRFQRRLRQLQEGRPQLDTNNRHKFIVSTRFSLSQPGPNHETPKKPGSRHFEIRKEFMNF